MSCQLDENVNYYGQVLAFVEFNGFIFQLRKLKFRETRACSGNKTPKLIPDQLFPC